MPEKPKEFQPSNESVQQQEQQPKPDANVDQAAAPIQCPLDPPQAAPAPANWNVLGSQESDKIMIRYADGWEEVINAINPDQVRRVVQAGRIIRPHDSGMSSSVLETSQPHPVSTSS